MKWLIKAITIQTYLFGGGAIGFVGYDMISLYEEIGQLSEDTIGTPDMHFFVYESYIVFDHKKEKIHIIEDALYSNRSNDELESGFGSSFRGVKNPSIKWIWRFGPFSTSI